MNFREFLHLVSTIKMLYGRVYASKVFEKNIDKFYNLNYNDFSVSIKEIYKKEKD
jgi:hypothetical protein